MQSPGELFCIQAAFLLSSVEIRLSNLLPILYIPYVRAVEREHHRRYLTLPCLPFYHVIYQSPELSPALFFHYVILTNFTLKYCSADRIRKLNCLSATVFGKAWPFIKARAIRPQHLNFWRRRTFFAHEPLLSWI